MQAHDMTDQSPDAIAARLERERADLALSINGLRDCLSTDALVGDALAFARDNTASYARVLDGAVRANPMAAVMAGVGLAWLVLGRKTPAALAAAPLAGTRLEALSRWEDEGGPPASDGGTDGGADGAWIAEADALRYRASGALAHIEAAARDRLRPAADLALDRASVLADLAETTQAAMLRGLDALTHEAKSRVLARREEAYAARLAAHRQGAKLIEEHPILAGAIGMVIGAAVAAALPSSRTEDRLFGEERDRLMARAQDALRQERARAAETVTQLADSVAAEVKDSARGLVLEA